MGDVVSLETLDIATDQPAGRDGAKIIEEGGHERAHHDRERDDLERVEIRLSMSTPYFTTMINTRLYSMTNWLQGASAPSPLPTHTHVPFPPPTSRSSLSSVCVCVVVVVAVEAQSSGQQRKDDKPTQHNIPAECRAETAFAKVRADKDDIGICPRLSEFPQRCGAMRKMLSVENAIRHLRG